MTIIALPSTNHDHLADALVRDLGFQRRHVDAPLRELLLALDPFVDSGTTMANMGPSPRLSSKLEQQGGTSEEERWSRLLSPERPGASSDRVAAEVNRLLGRLRDELNDYRIEPDNWYQRRMDARWDTVVMVNDLKDVDGLTHLGVNLVAVEGRTEWVPEVIDHLISPAGVVGEQEAIVAYVRSLRESAVRVVHDYEGRALVGAEGGPWRRAPELDEAIDRAEELPSVLDALGVDDPADV